ncbi:hypothetical protein EVG20_g11025, partial [Dentipellis fragilis]
GYSRLIVGLRAHDNNRASTVLELFLEAAHRFAVPLRLRGDHGTENLLVAAWMESHRGSWRGSYIWGRSVHNVRIERLWVDVTAQVGSKWAEFFTQLELQHGLDVNNDAHIWLLHYIFLPRINEELHFFASAWNQHRIQIRNGPNRSPADMFGFDMLIQGVRGDQIPEEESLSEEELELYGVDWPALEDDRLLCSQSTNNPVNEGASSWVGRVGPPENLNTVEVEPPSVLLGEVPYLDALIEAYRSCVHDTDLSTLWINGVLYMRGQFPDEF